jgi:hypothetical protein
MTNYIIEGGINFYDELFKMIDEDDKEKENEEVCLITNMPLTENYVTLECNHKFNYIPLFNDIKNHKKKFNGMEAKVLKKNEIRCPYCRNKQKKLLPYYESMGESMKLTGVNIPEIPPPGYIFGECCYYPNNNCPYSSSNVILLELNNKTYCSAHYEIAKCKAIKEKELKDKLEAKKKAKEDEKVVKKKAKEDEKVVKKKAKEDEKAAKKKAKEDENIVISDDICNEIIKTGKNKGTQCKCKVYKDSVCKRHYKPVSEIIPEVIE